MAMIYTSLLRKKNEMENSKKDMKSGDTQGIGQPRIYENKNDAIRNRTDA
jgi:hypothetical protein